MTKISVIIPWREQPSRLFAYEKLIEWYQYYFPNLEIIVSDSDTEKFQLSRARNLGAQKAIDMGSDIIIFNDADAFSDPKSLQNAIAHAEQFNEASVPYSTVYQHERNDESEFFFNKIFMKNRPALFYKKMGRPLYKPSILKTGLPKRLYPCSLVNVFPVNIFQELGGFNEDIKTWGPEDILLHRKYFDKYNKLFVYVEGVVHSTYNDPSVRKINPEYGEYYNVGFFRDKI